MYASHIQWLGAYPLALEKAQREHKPLMVLFVTQDCQACQNMVRDVFTNQPYIERINTHFVPVIITQDAQTNYPRELFYTMRFPTLFLMSEQEVPLHPRLYETLTPDLIEQVLKKY